MAKANELPSLRKLAFLFFHPDGRGLLYHLKNKSSNARRLQLAGCINKTNGYLRVGINGREYLAHRIIFAMYHQIELSPDMEIDHINGDKLDNRPENLRRATRAQNGSNRPMQANNKSGFRGVCFDMQAKKWLAQIAVNSIQMRLGYFTVKEEAALAYNEAAKRLHGEFARLNVIPETPRLGRPLGEQLTLFDLPKENASTWGRGAISNT
jgi:hypothetical protein